AGAAVALDGSRAVSATLVLLVGGIGVGKSTLARGLGERWGWPVVSHDAIREQLPARPTYTDEETRLVRRIGMLAVRRETLADGTVVYDGTHLSAASRAGAVAAAPEGTTV